MATAYLDANSGSDASGNGSSSSPWKTFSYAHGQIASGDTLLCKGTHATPVVIRKAMTLKPWPGNTFTIDGNYLYPTGALTKEGNFPPYGYSAGHVWDGLIDIRANNVTVEDVFITRSRGRGVLVNESSNVTLKNVSGDRIRHALIGTVETVNLTIDGGTWRDTVNYAPFIRPATVLNFPAGFSTRRDSGMIVRNMDIAGMWGAGIIMLQVDNCLVENNRVSETWRPAYNLSTATNTILRNNYGFWPTNGGFNEAYAGIIVFPESPFGDCTNLDIYNNIIVGGRAGFQYSADDQRADNIWVYNNTFVLPVETGIRMNKPDFTGGFKNNIFYLPSDARTRWYTRGTPAATYSKNIWFGGIRDNYGFGNDEIFGNPQLVDPTPARDTNNSKTKYYIRIASSPAVGAGVTTITTGKPAPTTDIRGAARGAQIDIGAHEFDGSVPPVQDCAGNTLTNGQFNNGSTGWGTDSATLTVTGGVARAVASAGGQLYQANKSVDLNATYAVEFDAKSTVAGTVVRAQVVSDTTGTNLGLNQSFALTTTMARYTVTFIANATDATARVRLFVPHGGTIDVDNVCFYLGAPAPPPPNPPGANGDVVARSSKVASPIDTNTIQVRSTDIVTTPIAALVLSAHPSSNGARTSFGAIDSEGAVSGSILSRHAVNPTATKVRGSRTDVLHLMRNDGTLIGHNATAQLVSGGINYLKSAAPNFAAEIMTLLLAGSGVKASAGAFLSTTPVTGLGFAPNLLITFGYNYDFSQEGVGGHARMSLGFATSPTNQYNYTFNDTDNVTPTDLASRLSNDCMHYYVPTNEKISLASFDANGFTMSHGSSAARQLGYLALQLNGPSIYLNTFVMPSTTGVQSINMGFTPQQAMLITTRLSILNGTQSTNTAGAFCIGMIDAASQGSFSYYSRDNVASSDAGALINSSLVNVTTHQGVPEQVATGALTSTGIDLTYTAVNTATTYGLILGIEYVVPTKNRQKIRMLRQGAGFGLRPGF